MRACVVQFVQFEAERRFASRAVERVEASGFENKEFTLPYRNAGLCRTGILYNDHLDHTTKFTSCHSFFSGKVTVWFRSSHNKLPPEPPPTHKLPS